MKNRMFLLSSLLLLSSCADFTAKFSRLKGESTAVQFSARGNALLANTLLGGIMVYAIRTTDGYRQAIRLNHENDQREVILPNGSYRFQALGWAATPLMGSPKCGFHMPEAPITLSGTSVTIPITLSEAGCANDQFGSGSFRSGSLLISPTLKFCGGAVPLENFSGSQDCTQGKESYRFFRGAPTGSSGEDMADIDQVSGRFVYMGGVHATNRIELFSVPLSGKGTVKQNNPYGASAEGVTAFEIVPGSGKVIYIAAQNHVDTTEAFISTLGTPGATAISGSVTLGTLSGVKDILTGGNGTHLVFAGEMETAGKVEVYSVNLATGARTKLSSASPAGTGVAMDGGSNWLIDLSPDGNHVVFVGRFDAANDLDLYSAPVNGTANSAVKLSTSGGNDLTVSEFAITYDSQYVVWKGDPNSPGTMDLFRSPIAGGVFEQINLGSTWSAVNSRIFLSPNSLKVAFAADVTAVSNYFDLYTADLSLASPFNLIKVQASGATNKEFHELQFSSDNSKIFYLSDITGSYAVYSATVGESISAYQRDHADALAATPSGANSHPFFESSGNLVFYEGEETGFTGSRLYSFSLDDNDPALPISPNSPSTIGAFELGFGKLLYALDPSTPNIFQLFSHIPGIAGQTEIPVLGPLLESIIDVHTFDTGSQPPDFPNAIVLSGKFPGSSREDIYLLADHTDENSLRKLTRLYDHPNGVGRFRLSLLEYKTNSSGVIVETAPGLQSSCQQGPTSDGLGVNLNGLGLRIPAGAAGANGGHFALAIDIFPEATDCSGSPNRILLPKGLANVGLSPQASKLQLGDSSGPVLYIKD
jgi:hypothetical protein